MPKFRLAYIGVLLAAIGLNTAPTLVGLASSAIAADAPLRPEIGKSLLAAGELMKAKKYKDALAKVHETDAIEGKTPTEIYTIERMRGAIAASAGDNATAAKAFEAAIETGKLPQAEQLKFMQALGGMYYQIKEYGKSATWTSRYLKEGGDDPKMRTLLVQSYFLGGDYARATKEAMNEIENDEKAGRAPSEEMLQLLANCAAKQNDKDAYMKAMEKLVANYPKKEYWADLVSRIRTRPGFADRLNLDLLRLKLAIGQLSNTDDYMEFAQLSLQAGFPAEAVKVIEQGYKTGALGTGAEAARQKRLRDLATKTATDDQKTMAQGEAEAAKAKDGAALLNLGYAYVTAGQADKGIALMEQGMRKGGFKRPDDAKLHMGIAYFLTGRKNDAIQVLKTVQGNDGTADLARYWIIQASQPA